MHGGDVWNLSVQLGVQVASVLGGFKKVTEFGQFEFAAEVGLRVG